MSEKGHGSSSSDGQQSRCREGTCQALQWELERCAEIWHSKLDNWICCNLSHHPDYNCKGIVPLRYPSNPISFGFLVHALTCLFQDHLVTMTQSLNHYEKILSRSHSNYLAQISIEMTDANNQVNDVLSKLTALGTVLVPMNLITGDSLLRDFWCQIRTLTLALGIWGMNVHVPGQDIQVGYTWFIS